MTEINNITAKLHKKCVRLVLSLYGKANSIHISRDIIRILGFPRYISLRIKDKKYIAILPSNVKEPMSFLVPKSLFDGKNGQFRITSKGFITTIFNDNDLDTNRTYLITGDYSEKENAIFFNIKNRKIIINGEILQDLNPQEINK